MAFSYQTSVVYHQQEEKNESYRMAVFDEGHPFQVEFAAVSDGCGHCDAGAEFVRFLLSKSSQKHIMNTNFMFPVVRGIIKKTAYANLPKVKLRPWSARPTEETTQILEYWGSVNQ